MKVVIILLLSLVLAYISYKYQKVKKQLASKQDEMQKLLTQLDLHSQTNKFTDDNNKSKVIVSKNENVSRIEGVEIDNSLKDEDIKDKKAQKVKRKNLSVRPKEEQYFELSIYSSSSKVTKKEAMSIINQSLGFNKLSNSNTNYANINKSKPVWWLNIDPDKFKSDLHLILVEPKGFIWITIPKDICDDPRKKFRIREDKQLVDMEISAERGYLYLKDVKSGSSGFDFNNYIQRIYK